MADMLGRQAGLVEDQPCATARFAVGGEGFVRFRVHEGAIDAPRRGLECDFPDESTLPWVLLLAWLYS
jgi:hypothetical protein